MTPNAPVRTHRTPRIYRNHKRYATVLVGGQTELTLRDKMDGVALEELLLASHAGAVFDHTHQAHREGGALQGIAGPIVNCRPPPFPPALASPHLYSRALFLG